MDIEVGLLAGKTPYIRGGSGDREALVLLGANALFKPLERTTEPGRYLGQVTRLLPGYRVTILGYASSSFAGIVDDIANATAEAPDLVMGISFGGFVATRLAAVHPRLARRLVLVVSAHRFSANGQRIMDRQFEALERGDLRTLVNDNVLMFRRPWFNWLVRLKLWQEGGRVLRGFRAPAAILGDYRALFGSDFSRQAEYCRQVACPTLVVGGTADQYFDRACFEETARSIAGARIALFDGETHMLPIEKAGLVAELIARFCE